MTASLLRLAVVLLAASGCATVGGDAYLAAKGCLARVLIARATEATLADGRPRPPWSWADFHPVARVDVPRLRVSRPVLSGATGAVLAFGLGHVDGTARPGGRGLAVVGGHRDGDAAFLGELEVGDRVVVTDPDGTTTWTVHGRAVVEDGGPLVDPGPGNRLWLVTCWPIDGVRPSDERLVVEAVPERGTLVTSRSGRASPRGR